MAEEQKQLTEYESFRKSIGLDLMEDIIDKVTIIPSHKGITAGNSSWDFSIRKDEEVRLRSDITDYFIETNVALQDNIAIRPIEFTVEGIVGEKEAEGSVIEEATQTIITGLGAIPAYLPNFARQYSSQLLSLLATAQQVIAGGQQIIDTTRGVFDLIKGKSVTTDEYKQQKQGFIFLIASWASREIFEVDTPYGIFSDCVIQNVSYRQPEESRTFSEVSITFKQLKYVGMKKKSSNNTSGYTEEETNTTGDGIRVDTHPPASEMDAKISALPNRIKS